MKTIRQSRLDRLTRQKKRAAKKSKPFTREKLLNLYRGLLKNITKRVQIGCVHGELDFGYCCMICNADKIAARLREKWYPTPVYKAYVFVQDDNGESALPLDLKTRYPTKKIKEMQDNGFWYMWKGKPVFMLPNQLKVVQLDDMVRSPDYSDPPMKPDPKASERIRHAQK